MTSILALSLWLTWFEVRSDTFIVKSSVGEARARQVLRELEAFHQALGRLVFRAVDQPRVPIEVLVLGSDEQLEELSPEYEGRKLGVTGYYQRGTDRDFIVLSGRVGPQTSTRVAYHELTHYFLGRELAYRPTWLSEGLAEYFAATDIRKDVVFLGLVPRERLQTLQNRRMLPLTELLAIDQTSVYYNETDKANVFYAQSWAFVHFLLHGKYTKEFDQYVKALGRGEADLLGHLKVRLQELEADFQVYLNLLIRRNVPLRMKASVEDRTSARGPVSEADVELVIGELLLSMGKLERAGAHLDAAAAIGQNSPRLSYHRGVLARMKDEASAREFFVDVLADTQFGPPAAVHLVQMHEGSVPGVRSALELASSGSADPDVYWALSEIYLEDLRRIDELIRLVRARHVPPPLPPSPVHSEGVPEPAKVVYAEGKENHFEYQLLSTTGSGPRIRWAVPPYYPEELLKQNVGGEVVLEVQLAETGDVGGIWLISAAPDIFANLATSAVRLWKFEPVPAKITVVIEFVP